MSDGTLTMEFEVEEKINNCQTELIKNGIRMRHLTVAYVEGEFVINYLSIRYSDKEISVLESICKKQGFRLFGV